MSDKTIDIALDTRDINRAIRELRAYSKELERKCAALAEAIAQRIADTAGPGFNNAVVNISPKQRTPHAPSPTEMRVSVNVTEQQALAIAIGEQVAFIEFGAGVALNGSGMAHPGTNNDPEVAGWTIGSYGKGLGNQPIWGYFAGGRVHATVGTLCQHPMYDAIRGTEPLIASIARSIFA